MKITDEMVERAYHAYYTPVPQTHPGSAGRDAIRHALEAAMNPPPVVCKHCGKPKDEHDWPHALAFGPRCPGTVWEPAP